MNLTMMLFLHDFSLPFDDPDQDVVAGPATPRPSDPSAGGGEGEPVGDDEDVEPDDHDRGDGSTADVE